MNLEERAKNIAWDVVNQNREFFDSITKQCAVDILSQTLLTFAVEVRKQTKKEDAKIADIKASALHQSGHEGLANIAHSIAAIIREGYQP
ncbi:MAG: hypothetical protein UY28_C0004G0020 [Candidatus Amesbacteria bacterium GW2011_GWB1_48_13]|uniref:Uncharacterized protein n=1 Tax=Candidatus Amesbacteria bacterium GW2011_GWB1_48_13 TaxID=1618362 RepID=A0A0G1UVV7_9BACT|nr:MAG: hypothetical protein UY28_C0004G0020 [Candidatus Amesbacteria bacterium GW2011_GWB1_48_13]